MALPIISTMSELMDLTKDVAMVPWTPLAANTPTSWACSGLPTGLSINSTTGVISGTPTVIGQSTCSLTAINGTGTSAAFEFMVNVSAPGLADEGLVNIDIDLDTGIVNGTPMAVDAPALLYGCNEDIIGLAVGFVRKGFLTALAPTKIIIAIRDTYEDKPVIVYNTTPGAPLDSFAPRYRANFLLTAAEILTKIKAHGEDGASGGTDFNGRFKCQLTFEYTATAINGVTAFKRTSVEFKVQLAKRVATA